MIMYCNVPLFRSACSTPDIDCPDLHSPELIAQSPEHLEQQTQALLLNYIKEVCIHYLYCRKVICIYLHTAAFKERITIRSGYGS